MFIYSFAIIIILFIFCFIFVILIVVFNVKNNTSESIQIYINEIENDDPAIVNKFYHFNFNAPSVDRSMNLTTERKSKMKYIIEQIYYLSANNKLQNSIKELYFKNKIIGSIAILKSVQDIPVVFVILRGTYTIEQIKNEVKFKEVKYKNGMCHNGILEVYRECGLKDTINAIMTSNNDYELIVGGYSLGGALGCLLSLDIEHFSERTEYFFFGTPKICNINITSQNRIFNIQNTNDIISNYNIFPLFLLTKFSSDIGKVFRFTNKQKNYFINHSLKTYYKIIDFLV